MRLCRGGIVVSVQFVVGINNLVSDAASYEKTYQGSAGMRSVVAESYHLALRELIRCAGPTGFNSHWSPAIWLLVGYTLETSLKAVALKLGAREADVHKLRHDLPAAFSLARELGFVPLASGLDELVAAMAQPHAEHFFRYLPENASVNLPTLSFTIEVLNLHIAQVHRIVVYGEPAGYQARHLKM